MRVSRCGYYRYVKGATYRESWQKAEVRARVKAFFTENSRRYGSRRIAAALSIGRFTARVIMKREGLRAIAPKSFVPRTTDSSYGLRISENLLKNELNKPTDKGEVFIGDITYLPLSGGKFCYLACLQDKFTRQIVGWKVSERMTAQLVIDVFNQARRRWQMKKGAIIHTDRGSQYASAEYRRLLYTGGFRQSMSGKGNCYDNAQAESFFSRLKAELLEKGVFESVEQAKSEIFSYIEGYYNRVRLHSSLGYQSPNEFEKQLAVNDKTRSRESFL
jgi:transposase InsO family protein